MVGQNSQHSVANGLGIPLGANPRKTFCLPIGIGLQELLNLGFIFPWVQGTGGIDQNTAGFDQRGDRLLIRNVKA